MCALAEIDVLCLKGSRVLTLDQWLQFEALYLTFRSATSKLGQLALTKKQLRWRARPKCHGLEHLVYDFGMKNPRYCQNFLDEDFIRRTKKLAIQSNARFVSQHVLFRYSIAACLRWTGMTPV